jgi:hypothetical protein
MEVQGKIEFKFKGGLGKFKKGRVQIQERERGELGELCKFGNREIDRLWI